MSFLRAHCPSTLLGALLMASSACSSSTGPSGLDATIREIDFTTAAEAAAWPSTPTISGGAAIIVRGTGSFGCGDANVHATRRGSRIEVGVRAANTERFCLGIVNGWRGYEVRVTGLEIGSYTVRVRSVGLRGDATWIIAVTTGS